jgi:hypothetical protein
MAENESELSETTTNEREKDKKASREDNKINPGVNFINIKCAHFFV